MSTMTNRWPKLVALLAAALVILAACGEDPDEETDAGGGGGDGQQAPQAQFETLEEGILTVGSDIPYPPFEYRKGGELVGLDIDLINEIASRLDLETEIVDTSFDTIFSQLAGGRFDVVIAASTITPEREEQVNFSEPYYNAQQSLTVQQGSGIQTTDDLGEGDTVAVQSGTTGKAWAEENLPDGVEIRSFPEGPDGYTALEGGDVDGVVNDEPTALAEVATRKGLEVAQTIDTGEAYGIAVDPTNEPLLDAVNQTLQEIIDDGTYEEIYAKYKDLPPGGNIATSG
jgi:ABC-type amino acid transport substrate-binding protein